MGGTVTLTHEQYRELKADAELGAMCRQVSMLADWKHAAVEMSRAVNWAAVAKAPSHAELERRRAEPGPMAGHVTDPDAVRRWVATGYSEPRGVAA